MVLTIEIHLEREYKYSNIFLFFLGDGKVSTCTVHIENKVKYKLDPRKVMFASGNGTERMRFAKNISAGIVC